MNDKEILAGEYTLKSDPNVVERLLRLDLAHLDELAAGWLAP